MPQLLLLVMESLLRRHRAQRSPRVSQLVKIRPIQVHRLITNTLKTLPAGFSSWSDWGAWSECDFSCSCSKKFRHRTCVASPDAACEGDSIETASCSTGTANITSLSALFFDFAFYSPHYLQQHRTVYLHTMHILGSSGRREGGKR